MKNFLPMTREELAKTRKENADFIIVTGDAYVDHPSFGAAVIGRVLENRGYSVGIISQPDWKEKKDFMKLGRPALGFLVTSGNIDSMVAHYTSMKKTRKSDMYSPEGKTGMRPDRAVIVYTSMIRSCFKNIPVILGGIEASLRRLSHYDYWSGKVRRSILLDSKADILVYGMGERAITEIADRLKKDEDVKSIKGIRGTVTRCSEKPVYPDAVFLNSYEDIKKDKKLYTENFRNAYHNTDPISAKILIEKAGEQFVIQNPPQMPLETGEMDRVYSLPYMMAPHPSYGGTEIPAFKEVEFSITSSRGCFGSCSFCALVFHQGRIIQARSHESIIESAEALTESENFKGYIHDVGGPTANFRSPSCRKQLKAGTCRDRRCLFPSPCPSLEPDHRDYVTLLRKLRKLDRVKKVFIRSGIRYDYLLKDPDVIKGRKGNFLEELCAHHVSGQLKIAPEHVSAKVLKVMGKPGKEIYLDFKKKFELINRKIGKKQFIIPYFISSHPGSGLKEAIELALFLKKEGFIPDQVQDFYPTPGTLSTCIYYTGFDPLTGEEIYVPKTIEEKREQKALIHFHKPENHQLVKKALIKAGRKDLIGKGRDCLIPEYSRKNKEKSNNKITADNDFKGKADGFSGKYKTEKQKQQRRNFRGKNTKSKRQ